MTDTEVQPGPDAGAGNDDVRAVVEAAFQQHREPPPDKGDSQAAATPSEDAPPSRDRDERGRFASTAEEGAEQQPPANTVPDADEPREQVPAPSTVPDTPTSWSADAKAEWSKLPPAVQQAVLKRETEINEGGRRWSEEKRAYDETLAPVRQAAQRAGVDEKEGLNRLLAANAYLERDPENAIRWLAQAYGVDLAKPNGNTPPQPPADPRVSQLHQEVTTLKTTLQERLLAETQQTIKQFASAPGHEHFEAVKVEMGRLLDSGLATGLDDAYEKAIWANGDVRAKLLAAQTAEADAAKAEAARKAAERAAADKAKRGAISASGSPAASGVPVVQKDFATVEDAVRAAFKQHAA